MKTVGGIDVGRYRDGGMAWPARRVEQRLDRTERAFMELSKTERLILSNQYRILEKLDPSPRWTRLREAVEHGYPLHLDWATDYLFEPMTREECQEVRDTLSLYEKIQDAQKAHPDDITLQESEFPGYGDTESDRALFVEFMHRNEEWTYLRKSEKAFVPMIARYREQLRRWAAAKPGDRARRLSAPLGVETVRAILASEETV